nr:X2-like carbohydrate binding domain-containing protein [Cloacibacillus evryensis]
MFLTVSPATATFSKSAPADVALTVSASASVSALKIGGTAVNSDNYTVLDGTLTITDDYLATLANGEKTFTVETADGLTATVKVTVGS